MTVFRSTDNEYLSYVFNSKLFDYQAAAFSTSTINQLTLGILNNMKVPFPPVDERRAIITFLNTATSGLDDAIETTMRQIDLMTEYRTHLIANVVTGQLDIRDAVVELPSRHL